MSTTAAKMRQLFFQIENLIEQLEVDEIEELAVRAMELTYALRRQKVELWLEIANGTTRLKEVRDAAEG